MLINSKTYDKVLSLIENPSNYIYISFSIDNNQNVKASVIGVDNIDPYEKQLSYGLYLPIYNRETVTQRQKNFSNTLKLVLDNITNINSFSKNEIKKLILDSYPSYAEFIKNRETIVSSIYLILLSVKESIKKIKNIQSKILKLTDFSLTITDKKTLEKYEKGLRLNYQKKINEENDILSIEELFKKIDEYILSSEYKQLSAKKSRELIYKNYSSFCRKEGLLSIVQYFLDSNNEPIFKNKQEFEHIINDLFSTVYTTLYQINKKNLIRGVISLNNKDSINTYTRLEREFKTINLYNFEYQYNIHSEVKESFELLYTMLHMNSIQTLPNHNKINSTDYGYDLEEFEQHDYDFAINQEEEFNKFMESNPNFGNETSINDIEDTELTTPMVDYYLRELEQIKEDNKEKTKFFQNIKELNIDESNWFEETTKNNIPIPACILSSDIELENALDFIDWYDFDSPPFVQGNSNKVQPFKKALTNKYLKVKSK